MAVKSAGTVVVFTATSSVRRSCIPALQEKGSQSRANFATEEEWQAHKSKQETLPKAAFQFGLKMADGRKSHKNLVGKANNKLKNELSSIKVFSIHLCCMCGLVSGCLH